MGLQLTKNLTDTRSEQMDTFFDDLYWNAQPQNSQLTNQPEENLGLILEFLGFDDLLSLAQCCKKLHMSVMSFLKHEGVGLIREMQKFKHKNENFLTVVEAKKMTKYQEVEGNKDVRDNNVNNLSSSDRRKLWWLMKEKNLMKQQITRISTTDSSVSFPHRGNGNYIPVEQDARLGRKICVLKNVCWLHVVTTFPDVDPGEYTCSLVLKVLRSCSMPHSGHQATEWIVNKAITNPRTQRPFWDALMKQTTPALNLCDGLMIQLVDEADAKDKWIEVTVPAFRVEEKSEVVFEMKDIECPWWKSGIHFDFVQLKRIS